MLRQGQASALRVAARAFGSSSAAEQQLTTAGARPSKGFLASLFWGGSRVTVPLTDALPGVEIPEHGPPPAEAPKTDMTTLANGFRIASEATPVRGGGATASRPPPALLQHQEGG